MRKVRRVIWRWRSAVARSIRGGPASSKIARLTICRSAAGDAIPSSMRSSQHRAIRSLAARSTLSWACESTICSETPLASAAAIRASNDTVVIPALRALRAHFGECGIGCNVYYPVPLDQQECFGYLGWKAGSFPESERAAAGTLALPIFPDLTEEQLAQVVDTMAGFYS